LSIIYIDLTKDTIASFNPSYILYETLAEIQGAHFLSIPLTPDFDIPQDLNLEGVAVLFLPNPNAAYARHVRRL